MRSTGSSSATIRAPGLAFPVHAHMLRHAYGYALANAGHDALHAIKRGTVQRLLAIGGLRGEGVEVAANRPGCPHATRQVNICRIGAGVTIDGVRVALAWETPMPGVDRCWFECPSCGRRCRHVYLRAAVACRRCFRLDYASRHLRRQTPAVGRVESLRRRLGDCEANPFAPLPTRVRRGRSRACHDNLVAMIHDTETELLEHLGGVVHDLKRRIRIRKARHRW
jgi:hypothetical protein